MWFVCRMVDVEQIGFYSLFLVHFAINIFDNVHE